MIPVSEEGGLDVLFAERAQINPNVFGIALDEQSLAQLVALEKDLVTGCDPQDI